MTTLREAAKQALTILEAWKHKGMWGDWDGVTDALKEALVEDAMQKFTDVNQEIEAALGCDHCNSPLYAAVKCRVCGRVTEPVQEPLAKCIDDICSKHLGRVEAFDHLPRGTLLYAAPPQRPVEPVQEPVAWRWGYRSVTTGEMDWRGYVEIAAHPNLRSPEIIMEPLFTAPSKRKPLSEEEILSVLRLAPPEPSLWPHLKDEAVVGDVQKAVLAIARAIERAHNITE